MNSGETLYVLKLQQNRYYIGRTKKHNLTKLFQRHFDDEELSWTKTYKPMYIEYVMPRVDLYPNGAYNEEEKCTRKYMTKYGIDNVRSKKYVADELTKERKDEIQKAIWKDNDLCTHCGNKECIEKLDINHTESDNSDDSLCD